jgi:cyanate permease
MFGLVLQGIARSSLMTVAMLTLIELPGVDEKRVGMASGLFFSAAEIGGVLGPLSIGVLYDASGGFTAGLFMLTGLSVLVLTALATLRAYGVDRARAPVGPRSGDGTG